MGFWPTIHTPFKVMAVGWSKFQRPLRVVAAYLGQYHDAYDVCPSPWHDQFGNPTEQIRCRMLSAKADELQIQCCSFTRTESVLKWDEVLQQDVVS